MSIIDIILAAIATVCIVCLAIMVIAAALIITWMQVKDQTRETAAR